MKHSGMTFQSFAGGRLPGGWAWAGAPSLARLTCWTGRASTSSSLYCFHASFLPPPPKSSDPSPWSEEAFLGVSAWFDLKTHTCQTPPVRLQGFIGSDYREGFWHFFLHILLDPPRGGGVPASHPSQQLLARLQTPPSGVPLK